MYSIADNGYGFQLDSRFGMYSYCDFGDMIIEVSTCNTIVGTIIDGVKWGITNIPASVEETEKNKTKIFPNPFNDKIYIKSIDNHELHYKISDITGKIVLQGRLKDNCIKTNDLNPGIYNLLIYNNNINSIHTIIKIDCQ